MTFETDEYGNEVCQECGRVFNIWDVDDAAELAYGHDCEE